MTRRDEMNGEIVECIHEVVRAIEAATTSEWQQLDLTMAQLKALFVLAVAAPMPIGALAQKLGIHLSAASHMADRLVQLGLADRYEDPEDRRRTFVQISAKGGDLVQRLRQGKRERFLNWITALDDEDVEALHQGLRAFAAILRRRRDTEWIIRSQ